MSYVHFIRHAQAGSRDNYDLLSDLGKEQAHLLGRFLSEREVRIRSVFSGTMRRQVATAEIVCESLTRAGNKVPDVSPREHWNEFNLRAIYQAVVPRLIRESAEFASDYQEMQAALKRDPHITGGATGRCDVAVIRAWIENRCPEYAGESWLQFGSRIRSAVDGLRNGNRDEAVLVFTSATPITIMTGLALGLPDEKLLRLVGVIYNSSITTMRLGDGELRLFTLNSTPHLPDSLRTFR